MAFQRQRDSKVQTSVKVITFRTEGDKHVYIDIDTEFKCCLNHNYDNTDYNCLDSWTMPYNL